ncbi:MAG: heat-inducible transcriptional repressor HrcA [Gammaproteobacteria bacterium]|nr:heat-inducible transcriptional repressor HrcA [Gammaproteobacteria bacterium]MDH5513475.1 heat-inducible transcriptional repressor HrcA [Gammaproteobacteria bacterium]
MTLDARAEILLKALIERYIAEGQPVGSRTLARQAGLDLSSATVRNVMADLEEMGLLRSPHTSAGRIPTERGYRVFVDTLMRIKPLNLAELQKLEHDLLADHDQQHLIENASHLLSEVCKLAGIVMMPRREDQMAFRHIDFVNLSARRVLVILVTHDGQVHNRIIQADRDYSPAELVQSANYFNETYAGVSMGDVKRTLLKEIQQDSDDMQRIMQVAVSMAREALSDEDQSDELVVSGESNLMDFPELGDVRKLRKLFDAFSAKRDLLHLLDQSMRTGGIKIFIGSESGYDVLADCSVVTAPYSADGRVVGTLGVIGPTRMAYEQVISIVDITARLLSGALSGGERPERLESTGR